MRCRLGLRGRNVYKLSITPIHMEQITIPKQEYNRLKRMAQIDQELVEKIKRGLEDIKHGRISEWKPKSI